MKKTVTKKELIIGLFILTLFVVIFTAVLYFFNFTGQNADGTFAAQILSNFRVGNYSTSTTFGDSIGTSMKSIWYRSADFICKEPLIAKPLNESIGHFYFIMYALIPFTRFISIDILMALMQSIIYVSVLFFAYFFSRGRKINIINSLLITVLVSQHPLWSYGIFGQFYFNRFFLPFSAAVIWFLTRKKINYFLLSVVTILALSVNEIYGVVLLIIFIGYGIFFNKKEFKKLLILGFVSGLYSLITMNIILQTVGPQATQTGFIKQTFNLNILRTLNKLISNAFSQNSLIFFSVNFIFLGIFSFSGFKTALLAFLLLLPNLLVNIGGAEKTGWSTHYHINYFVPLVWLSIVGFSQIKFRNKVTGSLILSCLILITLFIDPYNFKFGSQSNLQIIKMLKLFNYDIRENKKIIAFKKNLRVAVGYKTRISAPESIVYNLLDHEIYYYPLNIDNVDKVIFRYFPDKKGEERFSSINYGQQDENLDKCIIERMKKNNFDFTNPAIVDGWAVIGKK